MALRIEILAIVEIILKQTVLMNRGKFKIKSENLESILIAEVRLLKQDFLIGKHCRRQFCRLL